MNTAVLVAFFSTDVPDSHVMVDECLTRLASLCPIKRADTEILYHELSTRANMSPSRTSGRPRRTLQAMTKAADMPVFQANLRNGDRVTAVSMQGMWTHKREGQRWRLTYSDATRLNSKLDQDAFLCVAINLDDEVIRSRATVDLFAGFFEIAASRPGCYYGLCDVSTSAEMGFLGLQYGGVPVLNVPWPRRVSDKLWAHRPDRSAVARGVYWGNLFGSKLLQKLGGQDAFLNDYMVDDRLRPPPSHLTRQATAVFLSKDPMDMIDPGGPATWADRNADELIKLLVDGQCI